MSLINTIKANQLAARKAKDAIATSLLTTLMSDALMVAKNDGRDSPTDAEVVAAVRKFLKGNAEVQLHTKGEALEVAKREAELLNGYLPKQLTEEELTEAVKDIINLINTVCPTTHATMGQVMAGLKNDHAGQYEGALASKVVKKALAS